MYPKIILALVPFNEIELKSVYLLKLACTFDLFKFVILQHCLPGYIITSVITSCVITSKSIISLGNTHSSSSHPEVFCKKGVLRNFAKFT